MSFIVPAPVSVVINSDKPNPIRPVGSNVTLSCIVEVHPALHVKTMLAANIYLINPMGSLLDTTSPSISGSTYTSTATVDSFERGKSGEYNCTANTVSYFSQYLIESKSLSQVLTLTTGKK